MERVPVKFRDFAHMKTFLHPGHGSLHGALVIVFRLRKLLNLAGEQTADGGGTLCGQNSRLLNCLPAKSQGYISFFVERGHFISASCPCATCVICVARFARGCNEEKARTRVHALILQTPAVSCLPKRETMPVVKPRLYCKVEPKLVK